MTTLRIFGDRSVTFGDIHVFFDGSPLQTYFLPAGGDPMLLRASSVPQAATKRATFVPSLARGATMVLMVSRGGSYVPRYNLAASYIPTNGEGAAE